MFKFNAGDGTGINKWTGKGVGPLGFVDNTLVDGYPAIAAGTYQDVSYDGSSLAYLFDTSAQDGKAVYANATGLLQQDDEGYYYYDCTKNFASLDTSTNAFTLYRLPGVLKHNSTSEYGQFFPFNTADQVFNTAWGSFSQKSITCEQNDVLNHHFGMTMTTKFVQPSDGKVSYNGSTADMEYSFSGDDDVWVYIATSSWATWAASTTPRA